MEKSSPLLTEKQVAEIRAGVAEGIRGPVMLKWVEQLLADHDERVKWIEELLPGNHAERVRLERERARR